MDDREKFLTKSSVALGRCAIPKRRGLVLRGLNALAEVKDADYYFFKAEEKRESGNTLQAVALYERALTIDAQHEDALFFMGYCLLPEVEGRELDNIDWSLEERYRRACDVYKQLVDLRIRRDALTRDDYITFCNLGLAEYHLHDLEHACERFKKAIELNPDYDNAYLMAGVIYDEWGEHRDAAMYYQQAVEINPENSEAYYNLGLAQQSLGLYEDAVISFTRAMELNAHDPDASYAMGSAQEHIGFFHLALKYYELFLTLYAQSHSTEAERTIQYVEQRIHKMRALLTDTYYFNIGTRLWESGEKEEAMACFEIAVQLRHAGSGQKSPSNGSDDETDGSRMRPMKGMAN